MIMTKKKHLNEDLTDSAADQEKLQPDEAIFNLPELKDIPGATRSGKNIDQLPGYITISSSDEEADELLEESDSLEESDISPLEKKLLNESLGSADDEDLPVGSLSLDEKDNEGEFLQEESQSRDLFGNDLDNELVRQEDEESEGEGKQEGK